MTSGTFQRDPRSKYDMPITFGPTEMPDVSVWGSVEMVSTSFVTTPEAVSPFVPCAFDLPAQPVVTFSRMTYADVDYLGGRGYQELTVGVNVSCGGDDGPRRGSFMLVVWVDDVRPIIVGREYIGYAKLGAELPPVERTEVGMRYRVSEYGSLLYGAEVSNLEAVGRQEFDAVQTASREVSIFCWKHVPGPQGSVDADYPTRIPLRFEWSEYARGTARSTVLTPSWRDAPHSARIMRALAGLPVLRERQAIVAVGTGSIDRTKVERITVGAGGEVAASEHAAGKGGDAR